MTKKEIIDMARKSDFEIHPDNLISFDGIDCTSELIAFAKLVAAKEREQILFAIKEVRGRSQEPVAWMNDSTPSGIFARHIDGARNFGCTIPLYTTPPQRKPLPYEQLDSLWQNIDTGDFELDIREFARAIEAAHNIKE